MPGGSRPGSGRPKGSRNKRTLALQSTIRDSGDDPAVFLAEVYRDTEQPMNIRIDAAKAVLPYLHSRLSATTIDIDRSSQTLEELSNEELMAIVAEGKPENHGVDKRN